MKTTLKILVAISGFAAIAAMTSCTTNIDANPPTTGVAATTTTTQSGTPYGTTTTQRRTTTTQY